MKKYRISLTTDQGELIRTWGVAVLDPKEQDQDNMDRIIEQGDYNSILVGGNINPTDFDSHNDGIGEDILWEIDHHYNGNGKV
jgi:hypothetical protein